MIEKILFNVLAFAIFISIFWKLIKRNDTTYVYILILEFLGIGARFVSILNNIKLNFISILIIYIMAVIIPIIIIILEKNNIFLSEIIFIYISKLNFKY